MKIGYMLGFLGEVMSLIGAIVIKDIPLIIWILIAGGWTFVAYFNDKKLSENKK